MPLLTNVLGLHFCRCLFLSLLIFLIVLTAGQVAAQSVPPKKDIPAIAKAADGAIVTIVTAANDKPIALGTGFLVSPDGVIVTNYHVIKTGNVAVAKFPDGTALSVDGVLASDKVRDLAIIKIHGKTFRSLILGNSVTNSHLPPNTKMSAAGLDSEKMTDEQVFEDLRYCSQYPNDSLQEPDGQQLRCRDLTAAMEMQLARCKNGPDSKSEACKNMMAWFAALKN